jgi:hypothetical protein
LFMPAFLDQAAEEAAGATSSTESDSPAAA